MSYSVQVMKEMMICTEKRKRMEQKTVQCVQMVVFYNDCAGGRVMRSAMTDVDDPVVVTITGTGIEHVMMVIQHTSVSETPMM